MRALVFIAITIMSSVAMGEQTSSSDPIARGEWMKAIELNIQFMHATEEGRMDDWLHASHSNGLVVGGRFSAQRYWNPSASTGTEWRIGFEVGSGLEVMHLLTWGWSDGYSNSRPTRSSYERSATSLNVPFFLGLRVAPPSFALFNRSRRLVLGLDYQPLLSVAPERIDFHYSGAKIADASTIFPVGATASIRLVTTPMDTGAKLWPDLLLRFALMRELRQSEESPGPVFATVALGVVWH